MLCRGSAVDETPHSYPVRLNVQHRVESDAIPGLLYRPHHIKNTTQGTVTLIQKEDRIQI